MAYINDNFLKIQPGYLFTEVARRLKIHTEKNPNADIIKLGIGDVTLPLPEVCISAMHKAVDEMAVKETFRGYGPEQGYDFLLEKIAKYDYVAHGADIKTDEIFVSDGAKSDVGNIVDILGNKNVIAVTDPVYPVYVDTNIMSGREIVYLPMSAENQFVPELPKRKVDVIYLCFPNNPTGTVLTKEQLKVWVDYALENQSLILFDAAYEAFITEDDVPHTIYEIPEAKKVAIEFRSYSKTAGFTGTRCSYTVVPKECIAFDVDGKPHSLNAFWKRRQCTKFNGTPYIVQRAAEAIYTDEGRRQISEIIGYYLNNAKIIRNGLTTKGYEVYGGVNSPYIWVKCPNKDSWAFFDTLLTEKNIVTTPGAGFGLSGEGFIRMTAFNTEENTRRAVERF